MDKIDKILLIVLFIVAPCFAFSQDDTNDINDKKNQWEFDVTPYIWFAGLSGDISFLDQTIPVDASFKDISNNLSTGALLHAEAKHDKWIIMSDIVYMKIEKDGRIDLLSVDTQATIKQTVAELALGYNLISLQDNGLNIDGFVGLRYFGIDSKIDVGQQTLLDKTINANDPIFGVRFRTISEKWINSARIDVGGFGIGSETSWKANLIIGYQFSKLLSASLGFQIYGIDYEKNNFELDVINAGFATGLNFHF